MGLELYSSSTIPVLEQVVKFAESRHAVLAGNIANLDTPGYQTRDLSLSTFQDRLREAVDAKRQTSEATSPGEISVDYDSAMRQVEDSIKSITYQDGSNVSMEQQVLQINHNQYMHNVAITVMRSQFSMLQAAISERP